MQINSKGLKSFGLVSQVILAMGLGIGVGLVFQGQVSGLGELGKIIIQFIKAGAVPLLFFVIINTFISAPIRGGKAAKLFAVCFFNACLALGIGIGLSKFFRAGDAFRPFQTNAKLPGMDQLAKSGIHELKVLDIIKGHMPESLVAPFAQNQVIAVILVAVLLGLSLRSLGGQEDISPLVEISRKLQRLFEIAMGYLVRLLPLAVFGVVAKTVGEYGLSPFQALCGYAGVALLGLALQVLIVYQGWVLWKGMKLRDFWREAKQPVLSAMGINSSLATLPLTLKALKRLKVSDEASSLGACIGTNLNNDGILLYEGMALFFVAQVVGIEFTWQQHLIGAFVCALGSVGIAGIPEAGMITLALVLSTMGLPAEILPMLLTVDWIVGRARSGVNVLGDMTVSVALD